MSRHPPRAMRVVFGVLFAGLVIHLVNGLAGPLDGPLGGAIDEGVYNALLIGAAPVCLARPCFVRVDRLAWALVGFALLAWCSADVLYTLVYAKLDAPPYPSISDAGWLVFYPACWIAVVLLVRRRVREFHASLWLDGLVAALAVAACVTALLLPPIIAMSLEGELLAVTVNLAYPVGDLLLLSLLIGAVGLTGWRPDRSIALLGIGLALSAGADITYLYGVARGQLEPSAWAGSLWPASAIVTAAAAWMPTRRAVLVRVEGRRLLTLPIAAMLAAVSLLFWDQFGSIGRVAATLACATLLVAAARLWLTLSQHTALLQTSRGEATTDDLTGLGNRRQLRADLNAAVVDASPERPVALLLFDLNGFKSYNDSYGHMAGDALLARLGHALAESVAGAGCAYRMGGDEFCVLATNAAIEHERLAVVSRAALSDHGEGFAVSAALGTTIVDDPQTDPEDALRDADRRMYAEKNGQRASAGGQSTQVLLRVLAERDPDLGQHVDAVAALAKYVGIELGLSNEQLVPLAQAAVLHDVGKMAIPDAILGKPGPLDSVELAFMRRHTIVGERILQGAPALAAAGPIVRSSHERFDGHGYPDGLAGDDIPLGARIIAVCDAYHAMVTDRPYRTRMAEAEAINELRKCARGQFDPTVVAAFLTALERHTIHPSPSTRRATLTKA